MRGSSITLTDDLPGVNKLTILTIPRLPSHQYIRELQLIGLQKITDEVMAVVVSKLPALRVLNMR